MRREIEAYSGVDEGEPQEPISVEETATVIVETTKALFDCFIENPEAMKAAQASMQESTESDPPAD